MQTATHTFTTSINIGKKYFASQGWTAFPFQLAAWRAYLNGQSGIVNAPTGSGKTYSLFIPMLLEFIAHKEKTKTTLPLKKKIKKENKRIGLQAIWITPIKALAKEIHNSAVKAAEGMEVNWQIGIRTGDTTSSQRQKQKKKPPQLLITTPESLHLLLASKGYEKYFSQLKCVVIDEWHELIGTKRGVQIELALSRFKGFLPTLKVWGISATIGNMSEAMQVLMGSHIKANIDKKIVVESVLPDEIDTFPWAGHLGIRLLRKVLPIIQASTACLIFTNTRAQCEIWYQNLLNFAPELAGCIAMHHGSISREIRDWVEQSLHERKLKAVVCTSSLDLGVDFRPVETIVQIGSPKGIARFMQRAGRSGHQPGAVSTIHFVPTNALELIEAAAIREAIKQKKIEQRLPYIRSFDVLIQYLVTLAVSDGFYPIKIFEEVKKTFSFGSITKEEWAWVLQFISSGGKSLQAYNEYKKVEIEDDGKFKVNSRRVAMRHRMSIGTIVSDATLKVKFLKGKYIGTIEEWFVSQLKAGDVFWFAGRALTFVRLKEMTVQVKRSNKKKGKIPAWMGGCLILSSQLSDLLRFKINEYIAGKYKDIELNTIKPIFDIQQNRSYLPNKQQFLIEYFKSQEGYHLLMYPFEGRFIHEGMGALIAYRLSQQQPISFSIAMNDYGFELLSDTPINIQKYIIPDLFDTHYLSSDIQASINSVEMAKRKFRDIASIAGLIFKGYPGKPKKDRHLQASSQLFFEVFSDYEPDNLLLRQAYDELHIFQLQENRLRAALERIQQQEFIVSTPSKATPLAFPIMVDRLRERLSSERLEDRIKKMTLQLA